MQAFRDALRHLRRLGEVRRTSFLYETAPMYVTDQATFLNAACLLRTSLSPERLLRELKAIEAAVGRQQSYRNGPRLIDVDIILYGNHTVHTADLEVWLRTLCIAAFQRCRSPTLNLCVPSPYVMTYLCRFLTRGCMNVPLCCARCATSTRRCATPRGTTASRSCWRRCRRRQPRTCAG